MPRRGLVNTHVTKRVELPPSDDRLNSLRWFIPGRVLSGPTCERGCRMSDTEAIADGSATRSSALSDDAAQKHGQIYRTGESDGH
jgi:hypothetical protein